MKTDLISSVISIRWRSIGCSETYRWWCIDEDVPLTRISMFAIRIEERIIFNRQCVGEKKLVCLCFSLCLCMCNTASTEWSAETILARCRVMGTERWKEKKRERTTEPHVKHVIEFSASKSHNRYSFFFLLSSTADEKDNRQSVEGKRKTLDKKRKICLVDIMQLSTLLHHVARSILLSSPTIHTALQICHMHLCSGA